MRFFARCVAFAGIALVAGCEAAVASGLTESQANDVVVALSAASIAAGKEREQGSDPARFEVQVGSSDVSRALSAMHAAGVPRRLEPGLHEVFDEVGLVPTATEERARYGAAVAGELAQSLESLDGVIDAHVHIAFPEHRDTALDAERSRPRASVLLERRSDAPAIDREAVATLVAGAVSDLSPADVAVVQVSARRGAARNVHDVVWIGPVAVTRATAPVLRIVLALLLATCVAMAALVLALRARHRRAAVSAEAS